MSGRLNIFNKTINKNLPDGSTARPTLHDLLLVAVDRLHANASLVERFLLERGPDLVHGTLLDCL